MSKLTVEVLVNNAKKVFSDKTLLLHITIVAGFCLAFIIFAFLYKLPAVKFDALGYWQTATDLTAYKKGGAFVVLLAPFANAGIASYWAALSINLLSWILIGFTFWIPSKYRINKQLQLLSTLSLVPIGFWVMGISHVPVTEVLHIALILFGITQLFSYFYFKTRFALILSAFSLGLGLSIRLQSWPVFIIITALVGLVYFRARRLKLKKDSALLITVLVAMVIALTSSFFIETSLRKISRDNDWLEIYSRATIYTGLFSTRCGEFSRTAIDKLRSEIDLTVTEVFQKNLSQMGTKRVASVLTCKFNKFFEASGHSFANAQEVYKFTFPGSYKDTKSTVLNISSNIEDSLMRGLRFVQFNMLMLSLFAILDPDRFKGFKNKHLLVAIAVFGLYFGLVMLLELRARYVIPPTIFTTLILIYGYNNLRSPLSKKLSFGR